ncbi:MAG: heat-shock protein Hsp90 [Synergistaceae bacterium]|nr:heat-shock protein Hsp90 [Synergistaceae bacterium]
MAKQEILDKVRELIAAPTCNPELRMTAEVYVNAQDKESAADLVKALDENVNSIDETIALAESEMGAKIFGAEKAKGLAEAAKKAKAGGEKYCICPACQAGAQIYAHKEDL